jgi:hypothetical protein
VDVNNAHNIRWVGELIRNNSHITTDELCSTPFTGKISVMAMIEHLGYSKVCA